MPKLAANLSLLFAERPFLERFETAARAGFRWVEYQFPYEFSAAEVARCARAAGVEVVLHNLPRAASGEMGIAGQPGREREFRDGVERAIEYALAAGCPRLNCIAGIGGEIPVLVDNLRHAAARLAEAGRELMLEPINRRTAPGFLVATSAEAIDVLDAVGAPNAFLQYDLFHMQIMEGDLARSIERLLPRIGHIQLADVPGRHEPGTGEINFPWLLAHVDAIGYERWIGCEYNPVAGTEASLAWAAPWLGRR